MVDRALRQVVIELLLEAVHAGLNRRAHVVVPVGHGIDLAVGGRAHGRGSAGAKRVIGIELDVVQARVVGRLEQQRQIRAPVAGDHGIGSRLLDLGHIGREVAYLGQRRKVIAHDLHIGTLSLEQFLGELGHLLAVPVVLVDQIDLLDLGIVLHECGQCLHLHGGIGIETEMPVAAFAVGEIGIHRSVVQIEQLLALVARIVLFQRIHDRQRRARAIALRHIAHALIHGRAQRGRGLLRAELVVQRHDLELHARGVFLVELFRQQLKRLELIRSHGSHQTRQGINPGDLDGFTLLSPGSTGTHGHGRDGHCSHNPFHTCLLSPFLLATDANLPAGRLFPAGESLRNYHACDLPGRFAAVGDTCATADRTCRRMKPAIKKGRHLGAPKSASLASPQEGRFIWQLVGVLAT